MQILTSASPLPPAGEGGGPERLLVPGRHEAGGHRPAQPVHYLCGYSEEGGPPLTALQSWPA